MWQIAKSRTILLFRLERMWYIYMKEEKLGGDLMFIGKIGIQNHLNKSAFKATGVRQSSAFEKLSRLSVRQDQFSFRSGSVQREYDAGIYRPNGSNMKSIGPFKYTKVEPDERLKAELLPPSERTSYTEKDALLNQYLKQYRIEGRIELDSSVPNPTEIVRVILPGQISEDELESFRQKLNENGLGTEIDWRGVEADFVQMGTGFFNIERLEMKADYLASRYAVLKDRIQNQYTGDRQFLEMEKLEQIYTETKEELADSYAGSVGEFYEGLGQSGAAADMKDGVLAMVDKKAAAYEDYLAQTDIYAEADHSSDQWLKQDDAYMAARLRESFSVAAGANEGMEPVKLQSDGRVLYDAKDLLFAGAYAKSLSEQLKNPEREWNTRETDSALGKFLAAWEGSAQKEIAKADISDQLAEMLHHVWEPFMEKFMDALDRSLDENKALVKKKPWISGLIRTAHIDRKQVYASYQSSIY